MILDNKNTRKKVFEWLKENTKKGSLDIVTGYFTIGALTYLSDKTNEKLEHFRMILGDLTQVSQEKARPINLLNENITVETALKISTIAQRAVDFLKQNKVSIKTLEPNFCHAKLYHSTPIGDDPYKYFITGSSNLTEAGIGLKKTNNIELNLAETGDNNQFNELAEWFKNLWDCAEAKEKITITDEAGKETTLLVKDYLIENISAIFKKYSPKELYLKVLYELYKDQINDQDIKKEVDKLEQTDIYHALYKFQKKGVLSLIKILQTHSGAILADAVGLGKTWSALAVMKYFATQGYEIVLICPKKLFNNWNRYKKNQNSRFEKDKLEYFIRHHTCLKNQIMNKEDYRAEREDILFVSDKPRLFVIDESHNLRNASGKRYKFFVEEMLKKQKTEKVKMLLLSATPINNSLKDIKNQFKLIKKGTNKGFSKSHGIQNLDALFNQAQAKFNTWTNSENPKISQFIKELPEDFFKLTDSLIVARTRKMITNKDENLIFPKKTTPKNINITPKLIGEYRTFDQLLDAMPPLLSGYKPNFYTDQATPAQFKQREQYLIKLMYILLIKRLESSWHSFYSTLTKIKKHHETVLEKLKNYSPQKADTDLTPNLEETTRDDDQTQQALDIDPDLMIGKKTPIYIADIAKNAGRLEDYKKDLEKDLSAFAELDKNFEIFERAIEKETDDKSQDEKLQSLIEQIRAKQPKENPKVLIFTAYKDTAFYLYDQLEKRGFTKLAAVSGDLSKTSYEETGTEKIELILEQFAPYTKLFKEKEWEFTPDNNKTLIEQYEDWKKWIEKSDQHLKTKQQLVEPIDILIATDVLSEGQNLQDCDLVINYDIHWNPVRIIQRIGRIDRIGSPNDQIQTINYWPSDSINDYLNLKSRVERKMATMQLAGAEVNQDFSEEFKEMSANEEFEVKNNAKMLKQMETEMSDIETNPSNFGFDDLSLEAYRQDLIAEINKTNPYQDMPKAVYTGFQKQSPSCSKQGLIALLGYPAQKPNSPDHNYTEHHLIYIDEKGKLILNNRNETLKALHDHKEQPRFVTDSIEQGDDKAIAELQTNLQQWFTDQSETIKIQADGTQQTFAGDATQSVLEGLQQGDTSSIEKIKQEPMLSKKFQIQNFDLIVWFVVS